MMKLLLDKYFLIIVLSPVLDHNMTIYIYIYAYNMPITIWVEILEKSTFKTESWFLQYVEIVVSQATNSKRNTI